MNTAAADQTYHDSKPHVQRTRKANKPPSDHTKREKRRTRSRMALRVPTGAPGQCRAKRKGRTPAQGSKSLEFPMSPNEPMAAAQNTCRNGTLEYGHKASTLRNPSSLIEQQPGFVHQSHNSLWVSFLCSKKILHTDASTGQSKTSCLTFCSSCAMPVDPMKHKPLADLYRGCCLRGSP